MAKISDQTLLRKLKKRQKKKEQMRKAKMDETVDEKVLAEDPDADETLDVSGDEAKNSIENGSKASKRRQSEDPDDDNPSEL